MVKNENIWMMKTREKKAKEIKAYIRKIDHMTWKLQQKFEFAKRKENEI